MMAIAFICGAFVGALVGFCAAAMCFAAKDDVNEIPYGDDGGMPSVGG